MMKICLCPATWKALKAILRRSKAGKALVNRITKQNKPAKKAKRKTINKVKGTKTKRVSKKKLKPGIHLVKMKGGRIRKVKVLKNGQWRFMKRF